MKITRTSVYRLTIEKGCGCSATKEYEDVRYTKSLGEGVFTACEKHEKNKVLAEFAGEMLLESLDKEAEVAGRTIVTSLSREVTPTSIAGTFGETVTSMGAPTIPKIREKVDPLKSRTARFNRPEGKKPNTLTGNLNIAEADISPEEMEADGITIHGSIEDVPEDPRVGAQLQADLYKLDAMLDEDDIKTSGISQTLINRQAEN